MTPFIDRPESKSRVLEALRVHPAAVLLGPRQCGKTTLARMIAADRSPTLFFDLERAVDRRRLESPEQALGNLEGLVVLDEIQRKPELFETLRVLLDRSELSESTTRYLLLGSASPTLVRGVSETLAGRVGMVDLGGFLCDETGIEHWRTLWMRGGFPRSFLAPDDRASKTWRESFIRTFLEQDIPQLGIRVPPKHCGGFGPCWPTIMVRPGTRPSLLVPWAPARLPRDIISTSSPGPI